ncbi:MAG: type IV toxin-antitoxin system AbiEi family antitoxin domain-containing protein [Lentisphaeria bacterium]
MKKNDIIRKLTELAGRSGAVIRTRDAAAAGIPVRGFHAAIRDGVLTKLAHGVYAIQGGQPPGNPDLVMAARRVPRGVICLLSALYQHGLTTQIPHAVSLALKQHDQPPRPLPAHPPIRFYWFGGPAYAEGIDVVTLDGVPVSIYSPEKTLADIFKYRNKLGMDTVLEALRLYKQRTRHPNIGRILNFARVCRVEKNLRPYLEAIL